MARNIQIYSSLLHGFPHNPHAHGIESQTFDQCLILASQSPECRQWMFPNLLLSLRTSSRYDFANPGQAPPYSPPRDQAGFQIPGENEKALAKEQEAILPAVKRNYTGSRTITEQQIRTVFDSHFKEKKGLTRFYPNGPSSKQIAQAKIMAEGFMDECDLYQKEGALYMTLLALYGLVIFIGKHNPQRTSLFL